MAEKKEYRSSIRSRRMIREAFKELLREKEFGKITVTDIVTRADLNRSTFYAHYPDIHGVVEEIQDDIISRNIALIEELQYRNILKDPMPYLRSISGILDENIELFQRMGHTETLHMRLDKFRRIMVEDILNDKDIPEDIRNSSEFSIRIYFFIGGIMNTYQQWAEGVLNTSLEDISREISKLIIKSAEDFLDGSWKE